MTEAARQLGWSRSRLYELRARYECYGEPAPPPKPRPVGRHPAAVARACRDAMVAYAVGHSAEGSRRIAARLRLERSAVGGSATARSTTCYAPRGLNRVRMRLAAAEALPRPRVGR